MYVSALEPLSERDTKNKDERAIEYSELDTHLHLINYRNTTTTPC